MRQWEIGAAAVGFMVASAVIVYGLLACFNLSTLTA